MDTRDKQPDLASPGVIAPDTAPITFDPQVAAITEGGLTKDAQSPEKKPPSSPFRESLQHLRRDTRAMISLSLIVLFMLIPIFGPLIYSNIGGPYQSGTGGVIGPQVYHDPFHGEFDRLDEGPSAQYWFGTDSVGRDILARLMQGMLISIVVALAVEVVDIVLGITIGVLAGYYGGWVDQILARFTDIIFAFPGLLFVIFLSGILGPWSDGFFSKIPIIGAHGQARLLLVSLALATIVWPLMARFVRGLTLQLKQQQFIEAAHTSGTSDLRIIIHHIVPNLFSIVIVTSTLNIANTIVGEAGLSFLGLGVQSPGSSIGIMLSDALGLLDTHPWEALIPAIVLTIIVLAFSFLGDGLRDAFDPRSKD